MKKISLLILSFLMFAFCGLNAQTVVLSEDFSAITDSSSSTITNSLDQYTQVPGWSGDWVYPSNGKVKIGKASNGQGYIQTPEIDLSANNGQFVVTFDAKAWNNDATQLLLCVDGTPYTIDGLSTTAFNTFSVPLSGGTSTSVVKFQGLQANHARFFLDNVVITSQELGPDTVGPIVASATVLNSTQVALMFNEDIDNTTAEAVANYTFDNGSVATSASLSERVVIVTVAPAFTNNVSFNMTIQNVTDMAGNVMNPTSFNLFYGISEEFMCADIATLRSKLDFTGNSGSVQDTVEYKLTGSVIVTATDSYNNQKVLQDETGAILVYDPGDVLGSFDLGDEITGIYCTLTNYWGFLELVPTRPYEQLTGYFQEVDPLVVTLSQLNDNSYMIEHQAELIELDNVTITSTGNFAKFNRYDLLQNGVTAPALYPYFQDADYMALSIPTGVEQNIKGFNFATSKIGSNNNLEFRYYIVPRFSSDMTGMTSVPDYGKMKISVYPNPTANFVTVSDIEATDVEIYDINGKKVASQSMQNTNMVSLQSMSAGSYFLRLLKDGELVGTAKVIKR